MYTCFICHKPQDEHTKTTAKQRTAYIRLPGKGFLRIGTYYPRCQMVKLDFKTSEVYI